MLFKALIIFLLGVPVYGGLNTKVKNDGSLVVPGLGAERVVLNEDNNAVISIKGYPDRVSEFDEKKEFFNDILGLESPVKIYFDKIYYYKRKTTVVLMHKRLVTGIVGMSNSRVTIDSVDLGKGIEYFVFGYGNDKQEVLVKSNDKKGDIIYLYPERGIALVDDRNNDVIDMYVVFPVNR